MTLDYRNPNDWGKSPLTDSALRLHQLLAEISGNIEPVDPDVEETFDYPSFTGTEFLATHQTIDEHPYSVAFGQFLGNGIDQAPLGRGVGCGVWGVGEEIAPTTRMWYKPR